MGQALNLEAKSQGFTSAPFSGNLSEEFEHLAAKKVRMIDFKTHLLKARKSRGNAISRTRYGYDSEVDIDDDDADDWLSLNEDIDADFMDRITRENT